MNAFRISFKIWHESNNSCAQTLLLLISGGEGEPSSPEAASVSQAAHSPRSETGPRAAKVCTSTYLPTIRWVDCIIDVWHNCTSIAGLYDYCSWVGGRGEGGGGRGVTGKCRIIWGNSHFKWGATELQLIHILGERINCRKAAARLRLISSPSYIAR